MTIKDLLKISAVTLCLVSFSTAAVSTVSKINFVSSDDDGLDSRSLNVTGGQLLVVATTYDANVDSVLDGTLSVSAGGVAMTSLSSVIRPDGEVGSGVFYMFNPNPGATQIDVSWGVNSTGHLGRMGIAIRTFTGVDLANPFGSVSSTNDKSTGITLSNVEAGNFAIYSIGAQQGLGAPPLQINGVNAADVTGFINLVTAVSNGGRIVTAGMDQQTTGDLTFSHIQTARDASAVAFEINAAPVPEPSSTLLLSLGALGLIMRRNR